MKLPFVHGPDDLQLRDAALPEAGPCDVILQVGSVGICGSDLGYIAAGGTAGPANTPVPLGHELSGTVMAIGEAVRHIRVNDRVVVNPLVNMIGNGGPEGGFAEQLLIRDVVGHPESLLPLPASLSLEIGALVEPLAVAMHAINRLGAQAGDKIAIFGAGPIGLGAVAVLRHRGIDDVVVFDLSPFRRERAMLLGARLALDPRAHDPNEALMVAHGAVHFLEASGAPVLPEIVDMARAGATICVVSVQKKPVWVNFQTIMAKELTLVGALGYPSEFAEVLKMLKDSAIDFEPMISHRFDGADVMAAFDIAAQPDLSAKVLVRYSG
jgi:(R,R)-butanediol dehydrogenase/meso-butanediol dehydrogenase/diacetyl reductase